MAECLFREYTVRATTVQVRSTVRQNISLQLGSNVLQLIVGLEIRQAD